MKLILLLASFTIARCFAKRTIAQNMVYAFVVDGDSLTSNTFLNEINPKGRDAQ
jgi:hypothetical protein